MARLIPHHRFFRTFHDVLKQNPYLMVAITYTHWSGWTVHISDASTAGTVKPDRLVSAAHADRDQALKQAEKELKELYP